MSQESRRGSTTGAAGTGITAAARYLHNLLDKNPDYRRMWERKAERTSRKGVNRTAVARLIMNYAAWEFPIDSERQILDRVRRALDGTQLEPQTLEWFVEAFEMLPEHEKTLRELLREPHDRVRSRDVLVGAVAYASRPWRTLVLHEYHVLGPDGIPAWHETLQIIEALEDGFRSYPYTFDTGEAYVESVWGGTAGPVLYHAEGYYRSDISFEPMQAGEVRSLRYLTKFRYPSRPAPCFRRGTYRRVDRVEIRVEFHPSCLPQQLWWCRWDHLDGQAVESHHRDLDHQNQVASFHNVLEQAIVGFCWEW